MGPTDLPTSTTTYTPIFGTPARAARPSNLVSAPPAASQAGLPQVAEVPGLVKTGSSVPRRGVGSGRRRSHLGFSMDNGANLTGATQTCPAAERPTSGRLQCSSD